MTHLNRIARAAAGLVVVVCLSAAGSPPLEVVGLFKDRAVVRAGGMEKLLKVGDVTPGGVELLEADAARAVVGYQGEEYTLTLSNRVSGNFTKATHAQISVPSDSRGQYRIQGTLNRQPVSFLVDTGASVIAISSQMADRLGLPYRNGREGVVETAQGRVPSYFVTLNEVDAGGLVVRNVEAAIITGSFPTDILLGMSYLQQVAIAEENGVLSLIKRY